MKFKKGGNYGLKFHFIFNLKKNHAISEICKSWLFNLKIESRKKGDFFLQNI